MVIKGPEPGANIRPHVVPKAKKSEDIKGYYKRNRNFQRYVVSKPLA